MRSRRTENTTTVHTLPGGNEDNYLYAYELEDSEGFPVIASVWELSEEDRKNIANGMNIRLMVWGERTPPVAIDLTDEKLGIPKEQPEPTE